MTRSERLEAEATLHYQSVRPPKGWVKYIIESLITIHRSPLLSSGFGGAVSPDEATDPEPQEAGGRHQSALLGNG